MTNAGKYLIAMVIGVVLLVDMILAVRLILYGWPKALHITGSGQSAELEVIPIQMQGMDWAIVLLFGLLHLGLGFALWRLWLRRVARA